MAGKPKVSLTFALYQGDDLVRRETVEQDIVKVGKDPKSHLRVDDELASRMHAVIEVAALDDITLIDLGNEPGTKVNGANVNKIKINKGDQIEIGGTRIVLEDAVAAEAAAPAPAPAEEAPAAAEPAPEPAPAPAANPFGGGGGGANPFGAPAAAAASGNPFGGGGGGNPFGGFQSNNPFAAPEPNAQSNVVPDDAPEGTYTYAMVKAGPPVDKHEVEDSGKPAIEVMVMWDTTVLHIDHLEPPRSYYVGEEEGKNFGCDYFIPSEKLGTTRAPIVIQQGATSYAVLLPRSEGTIELAGQPKMTFQEAIAGGQAQPCTELAGAHMVAVPAGGRVRVELEGFVFQISAVAAGRKVVGAFLAAGAAMVALFIGLSAVLHIGTLATMAFFKPSMAGSEDDDSLKERQLLMQQYLKAAAEREEEEQPPEETDANTNSEKEGGTGTRAKGEEGSMGNPNTKATGKRYGVKGPANNPDPHIARARAMREAAEFGIIGLLNSGAGGDPNAPTAPWGRDDSLGNDAMSARGNMWGGEIGDSFGAGGLGLSGIGEGGGGRGEGIGLGNIGTIGHGSGTGRGQGFGGGHGRLSGKHKTKAPKVRIGASTVSGRLPREVVQRIVRQNFGRFKMCYQQGLKSNPSLQGRVAVRFVISRSGAVANVGNGGSDLPDPSVVSCVVRSFAGLSFPQPEGGIVTVVYPISFAPGS